MGISGVGPGQFRGTVVQAGQYVVSATIPSVATTVNGFIGSVTVKGARAGDVVLVAPVVAQTAGVAFKAEVTANDTIAITAMNGSAGAYNPGAQKFNVVVLRLKLA